MSASGPSGPLFFVVGFFFGLILNVPVNSYGHVGMVSSPHHTLTFSC